MVTVMHVALERTYAPVLGSIVQQQQSFLGSHYKVPLTDVMPSLSRFQFWIMFDTRFDDIDVICRLGGPSSKKTVPKITVFYLTDRL